VKRWRRAEVATEVSQFDASTVPWLLMAFGVGLFFGNTLGSRQQTATSMEHFYGLWPCS
jgi:predicted MFS family arabinose efflux permease